MNGLEMPGYIVWSAGLVVAAVALGAAFGAAALALAARGSDTADFFGGSLLLAVAIVAVHFTAMGAANIVHDPTYRLLGATSLSPEWLAVAIAAVTGSVLVMCFAGAVADRRTRRKINEQNDRLDSALNNMNQGLCMFDADNNLVVWNQRYVDMYGIDPKRIWLGCTIRDLLDARIAAGTFPLDPARYDAELRAALKQGRSFTLNIELADGRIIAVVNQPSPDGGWVATHEDITERKRAERELEHTRAFLDTIIEGVPSPIIVKSLPGLRYVYVNRAAEECLGIKRDDLLGKTSPEIMPEATARAIAAEDRKVIDNGDTTFVEEHAMLTPGNGTRIVAATRLPVRGAGRQAAIPDRPGQRSHRPQARRAAHRPPGAS